MAGLPRSGTTHLVNLIAADARLRSLPLWEATSRCRDPREQPAAGGVDPRYARCARGWAGCSTYTPLLAAMHPMHPDHIHEELELMRPGLLASYNLEWSSRSPRWRDHYFATRPAPALRLPEERAAMLQWRRGRASAGC